MGYDYQTERPYVFTDDGQKAFLKIRDYANYLVSVAGCCTIEKLMMKASASSSWSTLACIDRLVELGEFKYVANGGVTQFRILVKPHED